MYSLWQNAEKQSVEYEIKSLNDFDKLIEMLNDEKIQTSKTFNIKIILDKYDASVISKIGELYKVLPSHLDTTFIIDNKDSKMRCSDLERFIDLEEFLKQSQTGLYFDGGLEWYDLTEVINAQEQIENFTNNIQQLDASPFEKYLIVYDFLTRMVYNESKTNKANSRDITAVLNGDNIVCVGYAHILQKLCSEIEIDCYVQGSDCYSKDGSQYLGGHENNVVRMIDDKYGIDGLYYVDACWDSVKRGGESKRDFSHCLIPLQDKDKMKKIDVRVYGIHSFLYNMDFESVLCSTHSVSLGKLGIDANMDVQQDNSIYYDQGRRVRACERVRQILLDNNIPGNIYTNTDIPEICSVGRLIALCMEDDVDTKRIDEAIAVMQKIQKSSNFNCFREGLMYESVMLSDGKDDIYNILERMSNEQNKTEETRYIWDDAYTIKDIMSAGDNIELLKKMGFRKTVEQIPPQLPESWSRVTKSHLSINRERAVKEKLRDFVGCGEPISLETFKEALIRRFEIAGYDKARIEEEVSRAVRETMAHCSMSYDNTATNGFSTAILENYRADNGVEREI